MIFTKNKIDFHLRSLFKFERQVPGDQPISLLERQFQEELSNFFESLKLKDLIKQGQKYRAVDVGAKNFSLAPVIDEAFKRQKCEVEIHGIEVDAYRRLRDGYTRADYGRYFAKRARRAAYHPINFLSFQQSCDFAFLLHPFVSKEPLLAWGLPIQYLQPEKIFEHAFSILSSRKGVLILSHPSEDEFALGCEIAKKKGFSLGPPTVWKPQKNTVQKKPRIGCLAFIPLS